MDTHVLELVSTTTHPIKSSKSIMSQFDRAQASVLLRVSILKKRDQRHTEKRTIRRANEHR